MESETLQREHYAEIFSDYQKHYDDAWSHQYRNEFIYDPLFAGIELRGARVLEAMCGSGQATRYLLDRGALVSGLDISDDAIAAYEQRWPGTKAIRASILESGLPAASFDCVVVIGGLHHLHPHVDDAIVEIARILEPGGHFLYVEPHAGSIPDFFRKLWYKHDRYFADNEASVDVSDLARRHADRFDVVKESYFGGLAWLFVMQSLILRIPHRLKAYYTPPMLAIERLSRPLYSRRLSCMAACDWQKR